MHISRVGSELERLAGERRPRPGYYPTEEVLDVVSRVEAATDDPGIRQSIHFTTGIVSRIERQMKLGCTIVADSSLVYGGIDRDACASLPVRVECFMDDPVVVNFANQRRSTRAAIAVERALSLAGPKLMVVGSAPMAMGQLLAIHSQMPLREVCVVAAANGFANSVELKERIWESGLPCIVVRGRKGGATSAIAITNALIARAAAQE